MSQGFSSSLSTIKLLFRRGVIPFILVELTDKQITFCYHCGDDLLLCTVRNFNIKKDNTFLIGAHLPEEIDNSAINSIIGLEVSELTEEQLDKCIQECVRVRITPELEFFVRFAIELIHQKADDLYLELLINKNLDELKFTEADFEALSKYASRARESIKYWEV